MNDKQGSPSDKKTRVRLFSKRPNKQTIAAKQKIKRETLTETRVFEVMMKESDRGCVLVSLDFIADQLRDLLATYFKAKSAIHDDDLEHLFVTPLAMLSSVSARANLAYSLGLIEADIWEAISWIRQLRNIVGHSADMATLSSTAASKILDSFKHFAGHREDAVLAAGFTIQHKQPMEGISLERQALIVATVVIFIEIRESIRSISV